ncbi:unnamed protein product [Allacma fusca]|uniref:Uncharacterized protein n=1 Tax=Allacma fusca TaxID=39272 RepID=A0A8J2KWS3_9HEXA|nr:unnamed protein product [Allacma fusca]
MLPKEVPRCYPKKYSDADVTQKSIPMPMLPKKVFPCRCYPKMNPDVTKRTNQTLLRDFLMLPKEVPRCYPKSCLDVTQRCTQMLPKDVPSYYQNN